MNFPSLTEAFTEGGQYLYRMNKTYSQHLIETLYNVYLIIIALSYLILHAVFPGHFSDEATNILRRVATDISNPIVKTD